MGFGCQGRVIKTQRYSVKVHRKCTHKVLFYSLLTVYFTNVQVDLRTQYSRATKNRKQCQIIGKAPKIGTFK